MHNFSTYSTYDNPDIPDWIVKHEVHKFTSKIDSCLDKSVSRGLFFSVEFYHDVYRMLFGNKVELYASDFCSRYFEQDWDRNYKSTGGTYRGQRIYYPVRCTLVIKQDISNRYSKNRKGQFVAKPKAFKELLRVNVCKVNVV